MKPYAARASWVNKWTITSIYRQRYVRDVRDDQRANLGRRRSDFDRRYADAMAMMLSAYSDEDAGAGTLMENGF